MCHTNKRLECTILAVIFLFATVLELAKAEIIHDNVKIIKQDNRHCECIHYNCGCCEHLEWDAVKLNGTICSNVTYLDKDYGFSVTLTYNTVSIINETISARNPPPICFGEDITDFPIEGCLVIYDINVNTTYFHCCFELTARVVHVKVLPLHLGCVDTGYVPSSDVSLLSHSNILQITASLSLFSIILPYIMIN